VNLEPEGAAARCRPTVARLESERAVDRIWSGDGTFWKIEAVARRRIESSLGWLTLPERETAALRELQRLADSLRASADRILLLGMGGASLAPAALANVLGADGFPSLEVLDSIEPAVVEAAAARCDPRRTIFVVSASPRSTLETGMLFDFFFEHARRELGGRAGERFVVVTDPGSSLERLAAERDVRAIFVVDPAVPGRYAALSTFGLVPAALAGVDLDLLLSRARRMAEACRCAASVNPGILLGAALATEALSGRDKLTFSIDAPHERFGRWLETVVAESTGKEGKGIVPIDGELLGPPTVYGGDRFFVRYETCGRVDAAASARMAALLEHGHTVATFSLRDPLDLGAEMFRWQFATAVAAKVLGVNPFDEPEAEESRGRAGAILSGVADTLPDAPTPDAALADLSELIRSLRPSDYFGIDAYVSETPENHALLQTIAMKVRRARRSATSVQFAPRLLHSTGQLQKGGPASGAFLQVVSGSPSALPVPRRPWGFADVLAAQADADAQSLRARGRRVARVRLPGGDGRALEDLSAVVDRALEAAALSGRSVA
jgi:glucose-6-phosphate isomerase